MLISWAENPVRGSGTRFHRRENDPLVNVFKEKKMILALFQVTLRIERC